MPFRHVSIGSMSPKVQETGTISPVSSLVRRSPEEEVTDIRVGIRGSLAPSRSGDSSVVDGRQVH